MENQAHAEELATIRELRSLGVAPTTIIATITIFIHIVAIHVLLTQSPLTLPWIASGIYVVLLAGEAIRGSISISYIYNLAARVGIVIVVVGRLSGFVSVTDSMLMLSLIVPALIAWIGSSTIYHRPVAPMGHNNHINGDTHVYEVTAPGSPRPMPKILTPIITIVVTIIHITAIHVLLTQSPLTLPWIASGAYVVLLVGGAIFLPLFFYFICGWVARAGIVIVVLAQFSGFVSVTDSMLLLSMVVPALIAGGLRMEMITHRDTVL